jgi:hypothetical protein
MPRLVESQRDLLLFFGETMTDLQYYYLLNDGKIEKESFQGHYGPDGKITKILTAGEIAVTLEYWNHICVTCDYTIRYSLTPDEL